MSTYVNDLVIRYVCGMRSAVDLERMVMYPNKEDHRDIRAYDCNFYDPNATKISYFYIKDKREGVGSASKMPAEVSLITKAFANDPRCQNYNMRYAKNKWGKQLRIETITPSLEVIFKFIKNWDNTSGKKYGARLASSYDKNFFAHHLESIKDKVQALWFYLGDKLVAYSVIDKSFNDVDSDYPVARYLPRKVDITAGSNICQFVDYEAVRRVHEFIGSDFILHWGSAEKGIREYEHRNFPFFREDIYLQYTLHPVCVTQRKLF